MTCLFSFNRKPIGEISSQGGAVVFTLFKKANDATNPGRLNIKRTTYVDEEAQEISSILSEYSASDVQIGSPSSFGKLYSGTKDGNQVAIKIEPRDTDSHEHDTLKLVQYLRKIAPENIKKHLPIVYEVAGGKRFTWYVMELLQKLPEDIREELAGIEYELNHSGIQISKKPNESEDDFSKRLEQYKQEMHDALHTSPEEINVNSDYININLADPRLADVRLVEAAFDKWYTTNEQRRDVFNSVWFEQDPDDYNSASTAGADKEGVFHDKIKKAIVAGLTNPGTSGMTSIQAFAKRVTDAVAAKMNGPVEAEAWEEIRVAIPELIFAIVRTNWIPRFDPSHNAGGRYESLGRSMDHLPEDDLKSRLLTTLMWLSGHGLKWGDVHSGNIMMRPSTGDVVIIDYGLYRFVVPG